ncbi:hypothetical protein A1O7_01949 [Cladophialophora yegresii CBS 114405]|uniref:Uncharacterized protein n=1 Tax=Cladophialophora yegresii CBS 114405 TaxID=1182544 RepID=W9WAG2_9EURO|nr:uncharacterized protein A1O7_01949 [Cladophialophora yegresii CBS 114405]EXJ61521.1 hypothetical protein A1O7_01949 [Cladophialophora yegresii CBS 114405]
MVAEPDLLAIKKELANDSRDVADLWNDALRKYKGIVGEDLLPKFASVDAMVQFGTIEMENFHQFRHNQKKVDKLRSLFMANLAYIQKGAEQLIAAATPAFPPAAAIGTALTYMLSACKQVSADYDVVTAFFEDINTFLQRITILESRLPRYPAYRNCLMDVFTSVLEMCGFATKYIELGRFKKWILNMVRGEDGELGGARKKMDTSLSRLQSATEYAILGNTEELRRMNSDLQQNQDMQTKMMEDQTRMLEDVMRSQDSVLCDLQNIQKLLVKFEERRREDTPKQRVATKASGQNKQPPTSNQVRSFFEDSLNPAHEYHNIKESFIADTCTWIFEEPLWQSWLTREQGKDSPRMIALLGSAGSGKSHLAVNIHDQLVNVAEKDTTTNTCVAHFYFRESTKDLNEVYKAVNWTVMQIAEQNAVLCEKICVELQRDDLEIDRWNWKDVWSKLVQPCFTPPMKARLCVVWDGLDELPEMEQQNLTDLFTLMKYTANLNVMFVCTSREMLKDLLSKAGAHFIEVTKEKQLPDLKALIWQHLNNDSGLRKFSKYMKQRISSTLEDKADVQHLRQRTSCSQSTGRAYARRLGGLYLNMVADLQHHTPADELHAMKTLLCWLAYSYRPLTLAECLSILEITSETSFDLERELQGRQLARFLRLGDLEERMTGSAAEDIKLSLQTQNKSDAPFNDGDLPLKFQERSMAGFFRGGETGLRTLGKDGHCEIFIVCSDILCGRMPNAHAALRQYAAINAMVHLSWVSLKDHTEHDRIRALNALGNLMSNESHAATTLEALGVDYEEINEGFASGVLMFNMAYAAKMAVALPGKVSSSTSKWAASVAADVRVAFDPLARGHVANWFQAKDAKAALLSFAFAHSAIAMWSSIMAILQHTDMVNPVFLNGHALQPHLESKRTVDASQTGNSETDSHDDKNADEEQPDYTTKQILAVFNCFDDIPKDANAYLVVAMVLEESDDHASALTYGLRALEMCPIAYETIRKAFANPPSLQPKLLRAGLVTRAKAEVAVGKKDEAIASYEEARLADPEEPLPGFNLKSAFNACLSKKDDAMLVELVKNWKPMERLAWMTWDLDRVGNDDHDELRRAATRAGQQEYLYQAYDEVLKLLDTVAAAAPIRYHLAITHWEVGLDIEAAKALINETLDTSSDGYRFALTNEDPAYTLVCAVLFMSELIYEQYRTTSDPSVKAQLYAEIQSLTKRPLAQSVTSLKSELTHHPLTIARMSRKMATAREFQDIMEHSFNVCYDALTDNVGWNDFRNLNELAAVISSLEGLEKEAQILFSAQFSKLDPSVKENGEESEADDEEEEDPDESEDDSVNDGSDHDDHDNDDYPLPTDEGDLAGAWVECSGECMPAQMWRAWKGRPMYFCTICWNVFLCEDCYHKRQGYNQQGGDTACREKVGTVYCGTNHSYITPIPGWKGIKDGVMNIQGQNGEETTSVKFRDWLEELKTVKWKQAWERFWLKEE